MQIFQSWKKMSIIPLNNATNDQKIVRHNTEKLDLRIPLFFLPLYYRNKNFSFTPN